MESYRKSSDSCTSHAKYESVVVSVGPADLILYTTELNTHIRRLYQDCSDLVCWLFWVSIQTDDGEDDLKKGTQLLEIYALESQMYTAQKNNKKLKALYEQSLHIKSAIPHPLIMGVIRGKAAQSERNWSPTDTCYGSRRQLAEHAGVTFAVS